VILERNWAFWLIYPLFLTILWPFSVLFVSFFTGQFAFFKGYLSRVGAKLLGGLNPTNPQTTAGPIHIAVFASGAGSNAKKIIEYFENNKRIKVSLIVCNVPSAGVLNIAAEKGIPTLLINKTEFAQTGYVESLRNADIHFIVLAGFLWKVPIVLVKAFQPGVGNSKGIINIHPALLPKYGGKGMYGGHVHEAVVAAKEIESGISIHWVNEHYDEGAIIYQATCKVEANDTPATLAQKIHALEHAHFAPTIEKLLG
jgi:folate-dependent phosphoribosylglycinamide formyltransferase PurN